VRAQERRRLTSGALVRVAGDGPVAAVGAFVAAGATAPATATVVAINQPAQTIPAIPHAADQTGEAVQVQSPAFVNRAEHCTRARQPVGEPAVQRNIASAKRLRVTGECREGYLVRPEFQHALVAREPDEASAGAADVKAGERLGTAIPSHR